MISKGPQRRENPADAPAGATPVRAEEATLPASCPKCGTAIPSGGAWCPGCGLQVADICGACGAPLASAWSFCPRCGASAGEPGTIPCPSCREPVSLGFAFCARCGAQARPLCGDCGRPQRREWAFCPACGTAEGATVGRPTSNNQRPSPGTAAVPTSSSTHLAATNPEAEAFNEQGKRAYEADDLDAAIAAFGQAAALDPTNADYHTNLAVALDEREMEFEAFAAYQRALELNPRQVTALLNIGYLYSEKERKEEAREVWEQVIRIDPASEEAQEARDNLRSLDEL
jgi:predicted amidophosphoribosyltransferase